MGRVDNDYHRLLFLCRRRYPTLGGQLEHRAQNDTQRRGGAHNGHRRPNGQRLSDRGGDREIPQRRRRGIEEDAQGGRAAHLQHRFGGASRQRRQGGRRRVGDRGEPREHRVQERIESVGQHHCESVAVGDPYRHLVLHHPHHVARRRGRGRQHHERGQGARAGLRQGRRGQADNVQGRRGTGGGQGGDHGDSRFPPQGRQIPRTGRQDPQGRAAGRPPGNGQDASGEGRGGRSQRAVPLDIGFRLRGDVRGRGRVACPRPIRAGQAEGPLHRLHRRDRRHRPRTRQERGILGQRRA